MRLAYYTNIEESEFAARATNDPKKEFLEEYMSSSIYAFRLSTGEIIANHKGYCILAQSTSGLDKYVAKLTEQFGSNEMLFKKNPWKDKFPDKENQLIDQLLKELSLSSSDRDLKLLKEIDRRLAKLERPELFKEKYFLNIIAVVGAAINNEKGTRWKMELTDDKVTWHPYLIYKGETIEFVRYLYQDLFVYPTRFPYPIAESYLTVDGIIEMNLSKE